MEGDAKRSSKMGWVAAIVVGVVLLSGTSFAAGTQLVKNVDEPGRHAYRQSYYFTFSNGAAAVTNSYPTSTDKRIVLDFVSASALLPTGQKLNAFRVTRETINESTNYFFAPQFTGSDGSGHDIYIASSPTTIYVDPGDVITVSVSRDVTTGTPGGEIEISGHYLKP